MVDFKKKIFFGLKACADWPLFCTKARFLNEKNRHMTLAFLGMQPYNELDFFLKSIPTPPLVGFSAVAEEILFLPFNKPATASYSLRFLAGENRLLDYQKKLSSYLIQKDLISHIDQKRSFLPHVTFARQPFDKINLKFEFTSFIITLSTLHLYESLGGLSYSPLITKEVEKPFEEIDHTADIAYLIKGESLEEIALNAKAALMSRELNIEPFFNYSKKDFSSIESIVLWLNEAIREQDKNEGSPFKAVSHHGKIKIDNKNIFTWEMIVDV
ncbi:Conserved hypothetical protein [Criblamydia sequanensis CRIB-18]|uniref:2'-5' RNA ligase n=2 Tax=Candidatus Criblamydia sequanensis TaxID=340071 RepID=A0A090D0R1_9BACT|nr:Conserved hypothetical protein [Criblamydia sequanensis CRIB-18]